MKKTQTNWVFLTWSLCCIAFPLWPLFFVPWFLCSSFLSLGVALHYIHAFHSRFFLFYIYIYIYKREERKEKGSTLCSCTILSVLKTRLVNLFSHDMSYVSCLALMNLLFCTCMLCGKDFFGVYHFILILKSHVICLSDLILLRKA